MNLREIFVENFAGDLEYHPRRAVVYLILAVAAFCFWILSPSEVQFTTIPLVFALGSLTLLIKGIFLMRKSSEGLGLSDKELARLSDPSNRKRLPSIVGQVPLMWRAVIRSAKENQLRNRGSTTLQLEQNAMRFVEFVTDEVAREPKHLIPTE